MADEKNVIMQDAERIYSKVDLRGINDCSIIITGASGLIGTSLVSSLNFLIKMGLKLQVFLLVHSDPSGHLDELIKTTGMNVIKLDLAEVESYSNLPKADIIIHAAGYAQPIRFMANPISTIQINTAATIALLNSLKENGHFLFLSSSEVYCDLLKSIFCENDIGISTPYHPRASYIEGKRCGETICNSFRLKGIHATSVRLGDIYGPGTRKNDRRAINSFIEKAITTGRIELLDSGSSIRTYCYVSDAVELLWQILLYGKEPVYNVGGKSTITILDLAKRIGDITNTSVILPKVSKKISGSPSKILLNLARVEKEFKKIKFIDLEEGLRKTIEWQKDSLYS